MLSLVFVDIAKWVSVRNEFDNLRINGIFQNWEATLHSGSFKESIMAVWVQRSGAVLKLNVDGAVWGKLGPTDVGGVLHKKLGVVLVLFSKKFRLDV